MPVTFFSVGHDLGHAQEALGDLPKSTNFEGCRKMDHGSQLMPVTFFGRGVIN